MRAARATIPEAPAGSRVSVKAINDLDLEGWDRAWLAQSDSTADSSSADERRSIQGVT